MFPKSKKKKKIKGNVERQRWIVQSELNLCVTKVNLVTILHSFFARFVFSWGFFCSFSVSFLFNTHPYHTKYTRETNSDKRTSALHHRHRHQTQQSRKIKLHTNFVWEPYAISYLLNPWSTFSYLFRCQTSRQIIHIAPYARYFCFFSFVHSFVARQSVRERATVLSHGIVYGTIHSLRNVVYSKYDTRLLPYLFFFFFFTSFFRFRRFSFAGYFLSLSFSVSECVFSVSVVIKTIEPFSFWTFLFTLFKYMPRVHFYYLCFSLDLRFFNTHVLHCTHFLVDALLLLMVVLICLFACFLDFDIFLFIPYYSDFQTNTPALDLSTNNLYSLENDRDILTRNKYSDVEKVFRHQNHNLLETKLRNRHTTTTTKHKKNWMNGNFYFWRLFLFYTKNFVSFF